jgi:hypothetical protein
MSHDEHGRPFMRGGKYTLLALYPLDKWKKDRVIDDELIIDAVRWVPSHRGWAEGGRVLAWEFKQQWQRRIAIEALGRLHQPTIRIISSDREGYEL